MLVNNNSLDFVAIDFETADNSRSSACAIGIVAVKNGEIAERIHYYINPGDIAWGKVHVNKHGITPNMVKNAPTFKELWEEIEHFFEGGLIIAHNASSFDISVLGACLHLYDLPHPRFRYACTMEATGGWQLKDLCTKYNIPLNHHDALSDAEACALITIELYNQHGSLTPFRIRQYDPISNDYSLGLYAAPVSWVYKEAAIEGLTWSKSLSDDMIMDKSTVITGSFERYPDRDELAKILIAKGAKIKSSINSKTDIVIMGKEPGPSKVEKIKELSINGKNIEIVSEELLYEYLPTVIVAEQPKQRVQILTKNKSKKYQISLEEKHQIPQGPFCRFSAKKSHSPTGLTWKQLAEHEEQMGLARLKQIGVELPSPEMLYGSGIRYIRKLKEGTENEFVVAVEHFNTFTKEVTVYVSNAIGYDEDKIKDVTS